MRIDRAVSMFFKFIFDVSKPAFAGVVDVVSAGCAEAALGLAGLPTLVLEFSSPEDAPLAFRIGAADPDNEDVDGVIEENGLELEVLFSGWSCLGEAV